jgi:hypothetical protein
MLEETLCFISGFIIKVDKSYYQKEISCLRCKGWVKTTFLHKPL